MSEGTKAPPVEETAEKTEKTAGRQLTRALRDLLGTLGERAMTSVTDKATSLTEKLNEYAEGRETAAGAEGEPSSPGGMAGRAAKGALGGVAKGTLGEVAKGALSGAGKGVLDLGKSVLGGKGGQSGGDKTRVTNIVESIDIAAPVSVVYNQWTRFEDFPTFMKKVENVKQETDERLTWKAQIFWSHRNWTSDIIDQVPDERIVWRSEGDKGYVDGAVTFNALAPNLTRVVLVLEYHPKGFFENIGNLWRAQGRRARLELKHFARHVMTQTLLHPEEVKGWRGEIHEGQTVEGPKDEEEKPAEEEKPTEEEAGETSEERHAAPQAEESREQQPAERKEESSPTG